MFLKKVKCQKSINPVRVVCFLALFTALIATESSYSKTLFEYQTELNSAKIAADDAQISRAAIERGKANQELAKRDEAQLRKLDLLKAAIEKLRVSGKNKTQALTEELKVIQNTVWLISRIAQKHLVEQKKNNSDYSALLKKFELYKNSEKQQKHFFQSQVDLIQRASIPTDLIAPRSKLSQLSKQESGMLTTVEAETNRITGKLLNNYSDYLREISPYESFLKKYQLKKLESPQPWIDRLAGFKPYSNQRSQFFSKEISKNLSEIETKISQLMNAKLAHAQMNSDAKKIALGLELGFDKTVNELLNEELQLADDSKTRFPIGSRRKLRSYHDLYLKILSFQEQCSDLETLNSTNSPYFGGCKILTSILMTARFFFEKAAWRDIHLTTVMAQKYVGDQFSVSIQKLKDLKANFQKTTPPESRQILLEAIRIHDDLLNDWDQVEFQNSSEAKSDKEGTSL